MRLYRILALALGLVVCASSEALAQTTLTIGWDANPTADSVTGYRVLAGAQPGNYTSSVDVGNVTSYTFTGLTPGQLYYFAVRAYDVNGLLSDASAEIIGQPINPPLVPATQDFSLDGWPDLVWQQANGAIQVWQMRQAVVSSIGAFQPARSDDPRWQIVGVADFDSDGQADLLWQHSTTGSLAVWLMDGLRIREGRLLTPSSAGDSTWHVAAVGDFDRDGHPDLLWERTDGWLAIWFLNGTTLRDGVMLNPGRPAEAGWHVVGVGNLFGDGRAQIVWRHDTGVMALWVLNREKLVDGMLLSPSRVADPAWRVVGLRDIDADGKDDLIWQNFSTGQTAAWLMNGATLRDGILLLAPAMAPTWRLVAR
jgi:hypothetical protein